MPLTLQHYVTPTWIATLRYVKLEIWEARTHHIPHKITSVKSSTSWLCWLCGDWLGENQKENGKIVGAWRSSINFDGDSSYWDSVPIHSYQCSHSSWVIEDSLSAFAIFLRILHDARYIDVSTPGDGRYWCRWTQDRFHVRSGYKRLSNKHEGVLTGKSLLLKTGGCGILWYVQDVLPLATLLFSPSLISPLYISLDISQVRSILWPDMPWRTSWSVD